MALERLYVELERPLYNVVYRWVWNADDAMEVVQEAFLRVWRARHRVEPTTARAYLYRTALNLAANRRRANRVRSFVGLGERAELPSDQPAADALLGGEADRRRVRRAIDGLPEKLRRVVALTELAGLSYKEVAAVLGIPAGTVASRRSAALAKLRETLDE